MASNIDTQLSQKRKVLDMQARMRALEEQVPALITEVNKALTQQNEGLHAMTRLVEALVELMGTEAVDAKINEIADRKAQAEADAAKAQITKAIESGTLVRSTSINERSLIVGREVDANGVVLVPGRIQLPYGRIKPDFQEKLKGQGPGGSFETLNGNKFEVLEVYDVVEKKAEPATAETPAELDKALTQSES